MSYIYLIVILIVVVLIYILLDNKNENFNDLMSTTSSSTPSLSDCMQLLFDKQTMTRDQYNKMSLKDQQDYLYCNAEVINNYNLNMCISEYCTQNSQPKPYNLVNDLNLCQTACLKASPDPLKYP